MGHEEEEEDKELMMIRMETLKSKYILKLNTTYLFY